MADTLESLEIEVKHEASGAETEIDKITDAISRMKDALDKALPQLKAYAETITKVGGSVKEGVSTSSGAIGKPLSQDMQDAIRAVGQATVKVEKAVDQATASVSKLSMAFSKLSMAFSVVMTVASAVIKAFKFVISTIKAIGNAIVKVFKFVSSIAKKVTSAFNSLAKAVTKVASSVAKLVASGISHWFEKMQIAMEEMVRRQKRKKQKGE